MKNKQIIRILLVGAFILATTFFLTSCRVYVRDGHRHRGWGRGEHARAITPDKAGQVQG